MPAPADTLSKYQPVVSLQANFSFKLFPVFKKMWLAQKVNLK